MAIGQKFIAAVEGARDAFDDLFERSAPDAWMRLREGYGELRHMLKLAAEEEQLVKLAERADEARAAEDLRSDAVVAQREEWKRDQARHDAWKRLDREVQRGRILTVVGDDALTRSEIAARLPREYPDINIDRCGGELVALLNDMLAAGEPEREKEPQSPSYVVTERGGYRWRWQRATTVSPGLQDIERRLKEA